MSKISSHIKRSDVVSVICMICTACPSVRIFSGFVSDVLLSDMCTKVVRYMTLWSVPVKYRNHFTCRFTHTVTISGQKHYSFRTSPRSHVNGCVNSVNKAPLQKVCIYFISIVSPLPSLSSFLSFPSLTRPPQF